MSSVSREVGHNVRVIRLLLALSLAVAALGGASVAAEAGKRAPKLQLAGTAPVKVRGLGFAAGERVRVTVVSDGTRKAKRVVATRLGLFQVGFPRVPFDRCNGFVAFAVGSEGSRTALKLPLAECPPA
jgi:hypothetical protein